MIGILEDIEQEIGKVLNSFLIQNLRKSTFCQGYVLMRESNNYLNNFLDYSIELFKCNFDRVFVCLMILEEIYTNAVVAGEVVALVFVV